MLSAPLLVCLLLAPVSSAGDRQDLPAAIALDRRGEALVDSLDLEGAISTARQALALRRDALEAGDRHVGASTIVLASYLSLGAEHEEARQLLSDFLQIAEAVPEPDPLLSATVLDKIATVEEKQGDYTSARSHFERSLAIREAELGREHDSVGDSLNNLGLLLHTLGEYPAAHAMLERSLVIARSLGDDNSDIPYSLNNLAMASGSLGDYVSARRHYEEALSLWEEQLNPGHPLIARGVNNLAVLLFRQGDFAAAVARFERSLQIREQALGPDHPDLGVALQNLAEVHKRNMDFEAAVPLLERALSIAETQLGPEHPDVAANLNSLAQVYRSLDDHDRALELYRKAEVIFTASLGPEHPSVAATVINQGDEMRTSAQYGEAILLYRRGVDIRRASKGDGHPEVADALRKLGMALQMNDQLPEAEGALHEALTISREFVDGVLPSLSERQALHFASGGRRIFSAWLAGPHQPADASSDYAEILKWKGAVARTLHARREVLADGDDPQIGAAKEALQAGRLELVRATLSTEPGARQPLLPLTEQVDRLESELAALSVPYRADLHRREATLADLCAVLPPDGVLVDYLHYYLLGEEQFAAFVVRPSDCGVRRVDLGPAGPIFEAISAHRETLATGPEGALTSRIDARSSRVRELVWEPLEIEARRVVVVPDSALAAVSFAALRLGDGPYLIEEMGLSYAESATDLLRWPKPREQEDGDLLLVGGLDYGGGDAVADGRVGACPGDSFGSLPATRGEVEAIAARHRRHRRGDVRILTGSRGEEATVVEGLSGSEIVHFATHGFVVGAECRAGMERQGPVDPMALSGLVLAGVNDSEGEHDGILTGAEVSGLDLGDTELAVLSACETGLGDALSGEGILGLRRAFAAAGVRSLVMSLWSVSDEPTAELMDAFYRHHLRGRRPPGPAEALRRAQLERLNSNRDRYGEARPGDWAAFIAAGDWR